MFQRFAVDVEVLVYDKNTGEPLDAASVETNISERQFTTGGDGRIFFEMPIDRTCRVEADRDDYQANSSTANTRARKSGDKVLVNIGLDRPLEFELAGTVRGKDGQILSKADLTITNDCGEPVDVLQANAEGKFSFDLMPGCCYLIKAEKNGYLVSTENVCTRGRRSSQTINSTVTLDAVPTSTGETVVVENTVTTPSATPSFPTASPPRPLGFPTLYHDFNKAPVQELYQDELKIIYNLMSLNSSVIIEIASHTDARGPSNYNQQLSSRRAGEVADYLKGRGIDDSRFNATGYGESQPVNECRDGVKCSEEKHQENRRTEVRVVGSSN